MPHRAAPPRWARPCLLAAGLYNVLFGLAAAAWPQAMLHQLGLDDVRYPQLWQCLGMVVGVYGLAYAIAGFDPRRFWPIVMVGLLGKVLGPLGFLAGLVSGELPLRFGWINVANDLVWWLPFALLLADARPTIQADLAAWRWPTTPDVR